MTIAKTFGARLIRVFSSFGLSCSLLILLGLITWLGTLAQVDRGLFESQKMYFESFVVLQPIAVPGADFVLRVPLPGGYLLMALLFVNLVVGGIVRLRWTFSRVGILLTHLGVASLLVGGFITFTFSRDGHLTLFENQSSNVVESYHDWELVIAPAEGDAFIVPADEFLSLAGTKRTATIQSPDLPFDLVLSRIFRNCGPVQVPRAVQLPGLIADDFRLKPLPLDDRAEANAVGAMVTVIPTSGGEPLRGLLWGRSLYPWSIEVDGRAWGIDLRRRSWTIPFTVVLDRTKRVFHPGTGMPASFESEITKLDDTGEQKIRISMNKPLRYEGVTLFQSGWDEKQTPLGIRRLSSFAVVQNPADSVPLWSCVLLGVGLSIHFSRTLFRHIRRQAKRSES